MISVALSEALAFVLAGFSWPFHAFLTQDNLLIEYCGIGAHSSFMKEGVVSLLRSLSRGAVVAFLISPEARGTRFT